MNYRKYKVTHPTDSEPVSDVVEFIREHEGRVGFIPTGRTYRYLVTHVGHTLRAVRPTGTWSSKLDWYYHGEFYVFDTTDDLLEWMKGNRCQNLTNNSSKN